PHVQSRVALRDVGLNDVQPTRVGERREDLTQRLVVVVHDESRPLALDDGGVRRRKSHGRSLLTAALRQHWRRDEEKSYQGTNVTCHEMIRFREARSRSMRHS